MRWRLGRRSSNIEDRRGSGGGGFGRRMRVPVRLPFPGRRGGRMRVGRRGGLGLVGTVIFVLVALFLGIDPSFILSGGGGPAITTPGQAPQGAPPSPEEEELKEFVAVVLAETEDTWNQLFGRLDGEYHEPVLVLFDDAVRSACGSASSAVGPFYCPADQKMYLDLSFFRQLEQRLGAPGDFAQAYVVAHEVGHHVQNLLGISAQVHDARQQMSEADGNALSVRLELQADCFAGLWAHHADRERNILEEGDIEEALNAASAIGDDRLQRRSQGYVVPDSFTHGTSEQRVRWFRTGFEEGAIQACDTFNTDTV